MSARYALVVAGSKDRALDMVRPIATQAMSVGRLRIVQGDIVQKREFFPTAEARAWLQKAYNRGGSAPNAADRVRSVAVILFQFYPTSSTIQVVVERAQRAAQEVGFPHDAIRVVVAENPEDLRSILDELCFVDEEVVELGPKSLLDALDMFEREFEDDAIVSARARASATGWEFHDLGRVLKHLRAVHRIYGRWVDVNGTPITARQRKEFLVKEAGITLHSESDTVTKKYRRSRFPEMSGRELDYPLHIAYSYRSTRIHFWFPSPSGRAHEKIKTLVAHAGPHLYTGVRSQSDSG